jgi:hypothetical protein
MTSPPTGTGSPETIATPLLPRTVSAAGDSGIVSRTRRPFVRFRLFASAIDGVTWVVSTPRNEWS